MEAITFPPWQSSQTFLEIAKMTEFLELYHGSDEPLVKNELREPYRCVFAHCNEASALSHGDIVNILKVRNICKGWLDAEHGYEKTKDALSKALSDHSLALSYFDFDEIYNIVIYEEEEIIREKDLITDYELMIELQALRADVAKLLGFDAVDCRDEHGTSYQVVKWF